MKIALLGDIALIGMFSVTKSNDVLSRLKTISCYLNQFDYIIGNLETPFSRKKKPHGAKSAFLYSAPENIEIIKYLHISAVNLANNHIYDFGKEGVMTTIELLEQADVDWFGLNGKEFNIEGNGNKIGFSGYCCYTSNPIKLSSHKSKTGVNRFNYNEVCDVLERNNTEDTLSIISIHSGIEHVNRPSIDQIKIARKFAEKGPYVWYGHHPHVVQGIDNHNDSIIAHSLGNFIASEHPGDKMCPPIEFSPENRIGMILEMTVENNIITNYKPTFTRINEDGSISIMQDNGLIEKYSSMISEAFTNSKTYKQKREHEWRLFTSKRKSMRNIKWYLKRLRPRYARLLVNYKANNRKYIRNVQKYI